MRGKNLIDNKNQISLSKYWRIIRLDGMLMTNIEIYVIPAF